MNNSAHGMSTWHNSGGASGTSNYFSAPPGPYPSYPGTFQAPPGPPPSGPPQQGWGGYGAGGYGNYPGYAPWGYTVPPGIPAPPMQSPPDTTATTATSDSNKSNNSSNSNKSTTTSSNSNKATTSSDNSSSPSKNNPPLPPGPPPAIGPVPPPPPVGSHEGGKQGEATPSTGTATSSTSSTTSSKPQSNVETQDSSLHSYNSQDYSQGYSHMYHPGYNQAYDGYSGYGGGWYGPPGPPPPNFSKPPPGVPPPGVPPPSGPVKFNLPTKKGLGYNAFQHNMSQQQQQHSSPPPQQQQHQQQQQQQQQQQHHHQQQQHQQQPQQQQHQQRKQPNQQHHQQQQHFQPNNNKKKNKEKKNFNTSMMNNSPWRQYMNQQQREEIQLTPQLQQQKQQQQETGMLMNGKGKIGSNSSNCGDEGRSADEKRVAKDVKNMSGLVANGDWPESLKVYVGRCFARCQTELDKDQVEICLKGKLTQAANNGTLWTKNWEEEPLPSIHSEAAVNFLSQMSSLKSWAPAPCSPSQAPTPDANSASPIKTPASPSNRNNKSPRFKKQPMALGYMKGGRSLRSRSHSDSRSRSRSRSRSKSRSRSRSPMVRRGGRRGGGVGGDGSRRRHSSESDEDSRSFIKLKSKRDRSPITARGKMNKRPKNKYRADCHFYSEHGVMKLDPEFSTNERLQKRAARFNPPAARAAGPRTPNAAHNSFQRKKKQLGIKKTINNIKPISASFTVDSEDIDWSNLHVVGTSTTLEKQYLRLTTAPDPSTVRTVPTLMKALEHIKRQWVREQDYRYACDQLKSLRQDLTIQGIRDSFTVQVYETHSRIALEKGDHEEFNQCQSQLKQLYAEVGGDNKLEFLAYRLLYYIFTKNTLDITSLMAGLTEVEKCDECVGFALQLRAAWSLGNYHRFFRLYRSAPKMAAYLVDWFAERERKQAMRAILKGYRPGSLDVSFIRAELALTADEDWEKFESSMNLVYTDASKTKLDCKKSVVDVPAT